MRAGEEAEDEKKTLSMKAACSGSSGPDPSTEETGEQAFVCAGGSSMPGNSRDGTEEMEEREGLG